MKRVSVLTLTAAPLLAWQFDLSAPANVESIVYGGSSGENTGMCLASGDVNGDGIADMLVSAPLYNSDQGRVYVIYGESPLQATYTMPAQADVVIYGPEVGDRLGYGWGLATGDVNGDGTDDIVLGANAGDGLGNGYVNSGEMYIVFGSAVLPASVFLPGGADVAVYSNLSETSSCSPLFGTNISVGDIDGDAIEDIFVTGDGTDAPGRPESGVGYIYYGRTGWPASLTHPAAADVTIYAPDAGDCIYYTGTCYFTAHTTAVGRVDADGFADILWGMREGDGVTNGLNQAGELHLIYGSASLPSVIDLATYAHTGIYGTATGDRVSRCAMADIDSDGEMEILGGAQGGDGPGNTRTDAGEAYVIESGSLPSQLLMPTDALSVVYGAEVSDYFGYVDSWDYDGSGDDDIAMSTFAGSGPGNIRFRCGDIFGIDLPLLPPVIDLATDTAALFWFYGAQAGDSLSVYNALWSGDLDNDGKEELMMGGALADRTWTNDGVVYIVGDPRALGGKENVAQGKSRLLWEGGELVLELDAGERVKLSLFDASGRLRATLADGILPAGRHSFSPKLPAGSYIAVAAGTERFTVSFVVAR